MVLPPEWDFDGPLRPSIGWVSSPSRTLHGPDDARLHADGVPYARARPAYHANSLLDDELPTRCRYHACDHAGPPVGEETQNWVFSPTRLPLNAVLLQPVAQGVATDAEALGRPSLVAIGLPERPLDECPLPGLEIGACGRVAVRVSPPVGLGHRLSRCLRYLERQVLSA